MKLYVRHTFSQLADQLYISTPGELILSHLYIHIYAFFNEVDLVKLYFVLRV